MPKKFKFRLEQVLSYRQVIRDEKKSFLAEKNRELRQVEERLFDLQSGLKAEEQKRSDNIESSLELASLYVQRVISEINQQMEKIEDKKIEVESAKSEYLEAHKEVEVLEKIKDKQSKEYHAHIANEESKFLDELAVQRNGKNV